MGLVSTLQAALVSAVNAAGDTVTSITYRKVTIGTYDPALDTQTNTEVDTVFNAFVYALTDSEVDWFPADLTMQKVIINRADLTADAEPQDKIIIAGDEWEIAKIKPFPGGNIGYVIFIRLT